MFAVSRQPSAAVAVAERGICEVRPAAAARALHHPFLHFIFMVHHQTLFVFALGVLLTFWGSASSDAKSDTKATVRINYTYTLWEHGAYLVVQCFISCAVLCQSSNYHATNILCEISDLLEVSIWTRYCLTGVLKVRATCKVPTGKQNC